MTNFETEQLRPSPLVEEAMLTALEDGVVQVLNQKVRKLEEKGLANDSATLTNHSFEGVLRGYSAERTAYYDTELMLQGKIGVCVTAWSDGLIQVYPNTMFGQGTAVSKEDLKYKAFLKERGETVGTSELSAMVDFALESAAQTVRIARTLLSFHP